MMPGDIEKNSFQCQEVESALRESEERFRQMAEMTGEWLWEQDPRGYYIYSSTAVNQILGFSPAEVLGKHYTEFLTPQDQEEQQSYSASHQPFYALTNHYRHKDGRPIITESTGLPIINPLPLLLSPVPGVVLHARLAPSSPSLLMGKWQVP